MHVSKLRRGIIMRQLLLRVVRHSRLLGIDRAPLAVLTWVAERERLVRELGDRFKAQPGEIVERVAQLSKEWKATGKAQAARAELTLANAAALAGWAQTVGLPPSRSPPAGRTIGRKANKAWLVSASPSGWCKTWTASPPGAGAKCNASHCQPAGAAVDAVLLHEEHHGHGGS